MDWPAACASCAVPTADKLNHSATGMHYPYHTDGHTTTACTMLAQHSTNLVKYQA